MARAKPLSVAPPNSSMAATGTMLVSVVLSERTMTWFSE